MAALLVADYFHAYQKRGATPSLAEQCNRGPHNRPKKRFANGVVVLCSEQTVELLISSHRRCSLYPLEVGRGI